MKIAGKTDIGCSRDENQDTFRSGDIPGVGAWGLVCDGMGGAKNGRLASAVAADCLEEMLYQRMSAEPREDDYARMLTDAIRLANSEVFQRSGSGEWMMGTTAVCAVAVGDTLYLAHVGDSRAYLLESGILRQVTRDHSMVQEMVDMGTISSAEASRHPERNVITRALGVERSVEPSSGQHKLAAGDKVLLCSDGLTSMVGFEAIARLMNEHDVYDLPRLLVQAALDAGGEDNITVLVMQAEAKDLK